MEEHPHLLVPLRCSCPRQAAAAAAEARSCVEREALSPFLASSFSLTRRSETRATREREEEEEENVFFLLETFSVLADIFLAAFFCSRQFFFQSLCLFLRTARGGHNEPLHLAFAPRRVRRFDVSLLLLLFEAADVELASEERTDGDDQNFEIAVAGSDAASALPRRRCRRRTQQRRRPPRSPFLLLLLLRGRLRGRLGHQAALVSPLLDRRDGGLRRGRRQGGRRDVAGPGRRRGRLGVVVGVPGGVSRGVPRLRSRDEAAAGGRCCCCCCCRLGGDLKERRRRSRRRMMMRRRASDGRRRSVASAFASVVSSPSSSSSFFFSF